jgi:hypothetical protein
MVTGLANIAFAGVYATLGVAAESPLGFAIAFAAWLAIPAVAIFAANRVRRSRQGRLDAGADPALRSAGDDHRPPLD